MGYRFFSLCVALAMALMVMLPGFSAAEPVQVRGATHDGYGRIVFNWSSPVSFKLDNVDGKLIVSFSSPVEPILGGVVGNLKKYLGNATPGVDGRSVVFTLKEDFDVSGFDMGAAVVIDLTDVVQARKETKQEPEKKAPAVKQNAAKGENIRVRSGVHDGYTRIVFDWPSTVPYQFKRNGKEATLAFSRPARLGLAKLQSRLPKLISAIRSQAEGDGVSVTLSVPETSRVRHFLSGPKVVVDVMKPTGEPIVEEVAAVEPKADLKNPETTGKPVDALAAAPEKAEPVKPVTSDEAVAEMVGEPEKDGKPTALTPPGRKGDERLSTSEQDTLSQLAGVQILDGSKTGGLGGAGAARTSGREVTTSAVESGPDAVGIRIDWDEPVAAAVFRRVGYLWVVFDKHSPMNLADMKTAGGNIIRSLEQVPDEGATLLRMETVAGVNPSLKRDGLAWILEFRKQIFNPTTAIELTPQPNSPIGARLFAAVTEPGRAIAVIDPAIGDSLIVVPVIPLGYGIAKKFEFPQAQILPSSQGFVVKPRADDLRVRPLRQGVEITSASGLKISHVAAALAADTKLESGPLIRALSRLFDLAKWKKDNLDTFEENKWKYQRAAANAKSTGKEKARLDLARFYFANGFGPEALGVLKIIEEDRPEIAGSQEFRGLSGAINVLMGRFDDARQDLEHPSLDKNDEARFWRATLQAYEGDLFGAAANLKRMAAITRPYPRALKIPLGTLIAEAAIELGDIKQATRYLEAMRAAEPNPAQLSKLEYVDGRLKELSGDFEGAVAKWAEVQEGPHRPSRAKAAVSRTELLLKLKQIDEVQAIQELEKLRFAWRGDDFEFALLRRLGDLYVSIGDYRNGLRTMRQAATHFRDNEKAAEVTQQMTDAFSGLYLENKADALAPITAIALYDEFKELTPAGEEGDEMIRRLADRLVDVDLLDRAAALLQAQVEFRLQGVQKARVGAQLALVHILAHEFGKAIDVLDQSAGDGLPPELSTQRQHLRARSLMGEGLKDDALALLKDDKSMDADLLRREMHWNDKDWVQASQTLNRLLRGYGARPGDPLDDVQGQTVLDMAIAMTLSGNERGIDRLRRDHGQAMDNSRFRDAFRLIASPDTLGLISYESIAGKVVDVEGFQTFMEAYKDRLNERKLSAIN